MEKAQRNDPCTCGSGKKYKKCCMNSDKANYLLGGFSFKGKSVYFLLIVLFFVSIFLRTYRRPDRGPDYARDQTRPRNPLRPVSLPGRIVRRAPLVDDLALGRTPVRSGPADSAHVVGSGRTGATAP